MTSYNVPRLFKIFSSKENFHPNYTVLWIGIALLMKCLFFFCFYQYHAIEPGAIGSSAGDTGGYFSPIESLLKTGNYFPDYRMPGYGSIYFFFRLFFSELGAINCIIVSQWILAAISTYLLALAVYNFTTNKKLFYVTFCMYTLSVVTLPWDFRLLTESFTISFIIIFTYLFSKFWKERKVYYLFLLGTFYAWIVFLRPSYLLILLVPAFIILYLAINEKWLVRYVTSCLFAISAMFIVVETIWIIRNYNVHHRFIPLTKSLYAPELEESYLNELMGFVIAWGGDRTWWEKGSEITWFTGSEEDRIAFPVSLPKYIYTSAFNVDSLVSIRNSIQILNADQLSNEQKVELNNRVKEKLKRYTKSIQSEKPFLYHVKSRIILYKKFLFHSGTQILFPVSFNEMSFGQRIVKVIYTLLYLTVVIVGLFGSFLIAFRFLKGKKAELICFVLVGLYPIFLYPLLGHIEPRYFAPAYPFLLVCALYGIHETISTFRPLLKK